MKNVDMTAEEFAAFEAFKAEREKKAREQKARALRNDYNTLLDEEVEAAIPQLLEVSDNIQKAKTDLIDKFKELLAMKDELHTLRTNNDLDVKSHTFTTSDGKKRIVIGQYMNDDYKASAEVGIEMIRDYLSSLATDEKSQSLVKMVLQLLSKDSKGSLKAQRILRLRKMADESGAEQFIQGVTIIEEAYAPIPSKTFVRAYRRDEKTDAWKAIPLGMTES
jgi:hypothetical protein